MYIGFQNFRKYRDFPGMPIWPITFLVGGNNAGKSTVVKSLLLLKDFMNREVIKPYEEENETETENDVAQNRSFRDWREQRDARENITNPTEQRFYFDGSYFAHIGTFRRAHCNQDKSNIIRFEFGHGRQTQCAIEIEGDPQSKESTSGIIKKIEITIVRYNVEYTFDFEKWKAHVKFNKEPHPLTRQPIDEEEADRREAYFTSVPDNMEFDFPLIIRSNVPLLVGLERSLRLAETPLDPELNSLGLNKEQVVWLKKEVGSIRPGLRLPGIYTFPQLRHYAELEYIYAHAANQVAVYSARDTDDYVAKTIHEFAESSVYKNKNVKKFINEWMAKFKIGKSYQIESVGGEAHIVRIEENDGSVVNLADKGIGSIQLIILLFRIAIIMVKKGLLDVNARREHAATIVIEEPEQNLHPKMQSMLAEFFHYVYKEYGIWFIVETHSEYLIRKTQAMIATGEVDFNTNPFRVYYFPSDGIPYDMVYQESGLFEKKFDKGFFDEASRQYVSVVNRARELKE